MGTALSIVARGAGIFTGAADSALSMVLKAAVGTFVGVLGLGAGALVTFVGTVRSVTSEMQKTAREIAAIRNDTGRGLGDSARGYLGLRAAGLSGADASGFLSQAGPMADRRAGAWGLPGLTDPAFARALAEKGQGMGFLQRNAMLESISGGAPSSALKQLANTRPESIDREQRYQSRVQGALGVSPEAIRRLSDELPLFQNRVSMFVETVKMRFISSALPMIERGWDRFSGFLESNSERIAGAIESGVSWLYASAPQLLINGARIGLDAVEMLSNGIFGFGDGLSDFLHAISAGQNGVFSVLQLLASGFDWFTDHLQSVAVGFAATRAALTGGDILKESRAAFDAFPVTHMRDGLDKFKNSGVTDRWADGLDSMIASGRQKRDGILGAGRSALDATEKSLGSEADRLKEIHDELKVLNGNTKDVKRAIEKASSGAGVSGSDVLRALKNQTGRDSFLTATR